MPPRPGRAAGAALLAPALLLAAGCASATASGASGAVPPDLAGHQYDRPHADRVLVAGDTADLAVPGGTVRVRVMGPALMEVPTFAPRAAGELVRYTATFTLSVTGVAGTVALAPEDFTLLELTDQSGTAAPVPHAVPATAARLSAATVTPGRTVTGTWTGPVTEGHGEFLLAPAGVAPVALWDFRAER